MLDENSTYEEIEAEIERLYTLKEIIEEKQRTIPMYYTQFKYNEEINLQELDIVEVMFSPIDIEHSHHGPQYRPTKKEALEYQLKYNQEIIEHCIKYNEAIQKELDNI